MIHTAALAKIRRAAPALAAAALVVALLPTAPAAGGPTAAARAGGCTITGTQADNTLVGGPRQDKICGRGGADTLRGGSGNDVLVGGKGNDTLDGRDGSGARDVLSCGPGGGDRAYADVRDVVRSSCETVVQNDRPTSISLSPSSIMENQPSGTVVGKLTASDPDAQDTHTFSLVAGNGAFAISGATLRTSAAFDFETTSSYAILVRATDRGGLSIERALTVTITDVTGESSGPGGPGGNPAPLPAHLKIDPSSKDYGVREPGTTSAPQNFTVTNDGGSKSSGVSVGLTGSGSNNFVLSDITCSGSLLPGASCTFKASFKPVTSGAKSATARATAATGGIADTVLSGTGGVAHLTVDPTTKAFGLVEVGHTSAAQTFTMTNDGTIPATGVQVVPAGTDVGLFPFQNHCLSTLAPGASCTFEASFAPGSTGAKMATITVSSTNGGGVTIPLSGTGGVAKLTISPSPAFLGNIRTNTPGSLVTVTIKNTGEFATGNAVALSRPPSPDSGSFDLVSTTCGAALAPGASCTADVRATPLSDGPVSASLVASATPGGTATVTLNAVGATTDAQIVLSPTSASTHHVLAPNRTAAQGFTVTNTGGADTGPLQFDSYIVSGTGMAAFGFSYGFGYCQNGVVLGPGQSCTASISLGNDHDGTATRWQYDAVVSGSPGGSAGFSWFNTPFSP